uniref:Protein CASC3 n=1 Tax=Tetraodon nigroviridis TaxID=99883 RepID=H3CC16_TETNG
MADRRRRRRCASQDSEDDDESGSGSDSGRSGSPATKSRGKDSERPEETATQEVAKSDVESECESEDGVGEGAAVLSDYDSADLEENASHSEEPNSAAANSPAKEEEAEAKDEDGQSKEESKSEDKGNLAGERQSGDGQESTDDPETKAAGKAGQKLDDDEDRKNPAYIPRKGLFFEHDVRGHAQEEESRPKTRNRKLWKDEGRWEHDRFREEEQAPKSREELIAIYGYDIRNGSGSGERSYRQRRPSPPRPASSPHRDKRGRTGGERPARSWQSGGPALSRRGGTSPVVAPHGPKSPPEPSDGGRAVGRGREGPPGVTASTPNSQGSLGEQDLHPSTAAAPPESGLAKPASQRPQKPRAGGDRAPAGAAASSEPPSAVWEGASPAERPVERKSYSLARRTRSRPAELGSKQPSVEDAAATSASSAAGKTWSGPSEGPGQAPGAGPVTELEQDVSRLSLAGQSWSQSPTSYIRSEMRGISNVHLPGAPPQFSNMEEMGVASSRAKRYSSQRQRAVPEPTPPMHLGVMEGHYYEPISYQGPIYAHGDGPAPIPPQGMLVQPEMHLPHPGLHPHQSGGPIADPALYGGPAVSLSPGQPQPLLPPPFYPPPGVMTFPYPTMYPSPQGQSQVTFGGVTYYDTMQQQAQPKPSPPRRTSQPVTVKPPPPEVPFASE